MEPTPAPTATPTPVAEPTLTPAPIITSSPKATATPIAPATVVSPAPTPTATPSLPAQDGGGVQGNNRYEIYAILKSVLKSHTPAPIYAITMRHGMNRLTKQMQTTKPRIIKTRAGELGHLDCHYLSKDLIVGARRRYYLVSVLDDCTRLAWTEMVDDLKSLSVMFAALKSINLLNAEYGVRFEAMLTDNGPEVASPVNKAGHPMERMLVELGIKHRYTRPYRPQTNGKVERFWRTLNEDLLEGTTFEAVEALKDELVQYLLYYNTVRPHQGLGGKTPLQALQFLSAN